jgi:hypothetical protein
VWWTHAPSRAKFFCVVGGPRQDPLDNLRKRQVIMVNRCSMCQRSGELVDHPSSSLRCGFCFMSSSVIELFACWWTSKRPRSAAIWKMVLIYLFWCLWKERNNRCFENLEKSFKDILASFFHTLYLWTVAFVSPLSLSFVKRKKKVWNFQSCCWRWNMWDSRKFYFIELGLDHILINDKICA